MARVSTQASTRLTCAAVFFAVSISACEGTRADMVLVANGGLGEFV